MQQLLQLDNIITTRINTVLKQYEQLESQTENKEFVQQYERLKLAVALPISHLDEKIMIYNEYLAYHETLQQQQSSEASSHNQEAIVVDKEQRAAMYNAFQKRVLKLLGRLGVSDSFTQRVFKAIFSDENQLRKLKKMLDSLNDDSDSDCCLWDFIFGLF